MTIPAVKYGIRFLLLVLFQVLILNHINLIGFTNPYLYIYFILILPFSTPGWLILLLAFLLGICIDLFTHTPGLNAAATVLMAFARPYVIRALSSEPEEESGNRPAVKTKGLQWFFYYSSILVMIHHLSLFYLEIFRFSEFFQTLLRVLFSSFLTLVLVFLCEILFSAGNSTKR